MIRPQPGKIDLLNLIIDPPSLPLYLPRQAENVIRHHLELTLEKIPVNRTVRIMLTNVKVSETLLV